MRTDQQLLCGIWFHTYNSAHELQLLVYSEQTVTSHMSPKPVSLVDGIIIPYKHSMGNQGYFYGITPSLARLCHTTLICLRSHSHCFNFLLLSGIFSGITSSVAPTSVSLTNYVTDFSRVILHLFAALCTLAMSVFDGF